MLSAGSESSNGGRVEGAQLAQDGRDRTSGPLRKNVPIVQRSAHSKEEDAREKAYTESRLQRELRIRHPGIAVERGRRNGQRDAERPGPLARLMQRARERQSRVPFVGLG